MQFGAEVLLVQMLQPSSKSIMVKAI